MTLSVLRDMEASISIPILFSTLSKLTNHTPMVTIKPKAKCNFI